MPMRAGYRVEPRAYCKDTTRPDAHQSMRRFPTTLAMRSFILWRFLSPGDLHGVDVLSEIGAPGA